MAIESLVDKGRKELLSVIALSNVSQCSKFFFLSIACILFQIYHLVAYV